MQRPLGYRADPTITAERIIRESTELSLGQRDRLGFGSVDIIHVLDDAVAKSQFRRAFLTQINDPALHDQIIDHLTELADALEIQAARDDSVVDLLDRTGLAVSASGVLTGVAGMIAFGGGSPARSSSSLRRAWGW